MEPLSLVFTVLMGMFGIHSLSSAQDPNVYVRPRAPLGPDPGAALASSLSGPGQNLLRNWQTCTRTCTRSAASICL